MIKIRHLICNKYFFLIKISSANVHKYVYFIKEIQQTLNKMYMEFLLAVNYDGFLFINFEKNDENSVLLIINFY